MIKIRVLFLLMMVLALVVSGAVCESPPPGPMRCIDFEDLGLGTTYNCCGVSFHPPGYTVKTKDFQYSDGTWTNNGYAKVDNAGKAGGSGQDMQVNNINLDFNFGGPVKSLTLYYGEYGGNLNIDINGDFKNFNDFTDIHGTTIGGVSVSVTTLGHDMGKLKLLGNTTVFIIGGQELWIDNVCPSR